MTINLRQIISKQYIITDIGCIYGRYHDTSINVNGYVYSIAVELFNDEKFDNGKVVKLIRICDDSDVILDAGEELALIKIDNNYIFIGTSGLKKHG